MFSKKESKQLREHFWISFSKSFPRKWILYQTRLSGIVLKFHFDLEKAMVALDVEEVTEGRRSELWDKLLSLKALFLSEYVPNAVFDRDFVLENKKVVSRIYVQRDGVCIHDKGTWKETKLFLKEQMELFEAFLRDYFDVLDT